MDAMTQQALSDAPAAAMPVGRTSIVPADSIAGRALVAVVAIMTFLASLTLGAVVLVRATAGEWQSAVAREGTIQVRPVEGRDTQAQGKKAADLAIATPGIIGVRAYSNAESAPAGALARHRALARRLAGPAARGLAGRCRPRAGSQRAAQGAGSRGSGGEPRRPPRLGAT